MFKISLKKTGLCISLVLLSSAVLAATPRSGKETITTPNYSQEPLNYSQGSRLKIEQGIFEEKGGRGNTNINLVPYYHVDGKITYFDDSWECVLAGYAEINNDTAFFIMPPHSVVQTKHGMAQLPYTRYENNEDYWKIKVTKHPQSDWDPTIAYSCWQYITD